MLEISLGYGALAAIACLIALAGAHNPRTVADSQRRRRSLKEEALCVCKGFSF